MKSMKKDKSAMGKVVVYAFVGLMISLMFGGLLEIVSIPVQAAPLTYDKNTILCNHDFDFANTLRETEIQTIFDSRNSFFKDYIDPTTNKPASWVIADRAQHYQISSRVLLAKMQQESSSVWAYRDMNLHIYNKAGLDMGTRAEWVLFYGWSDTTIYPQYKGFYNQVDNAAKSLSEWFANPGSKGWMVGQTHPVSDGTVTPTNRATAALYIYTPWISSNELLYQVWKMMFFFYVPDNYPTIQAAVNAANAGDTIIVRDGTYTENVKVNKPHLTIRSENGADSTIVQAADPSDHVFEVIGNPFISANYTNISGFTVRDSSSGWYACGIKLFHVSDCIINHNNIYNNSNGIYIWVSSGNNITSNNVHNNLYDGIYLGYSNDNSIINNNIYNNSNPDIDLASVGIHLVSSSNNKIISNNVNNNKGYGIILGYSSNNNNIACNWVHNNKPRGFYLKYGSTGNTIENNNIMTSGVVFGDSWHYNFYNGQADDVTAENNYWGTESSTIIVESIYDKNDDSSKGTVDFEPFRTDPAPCAAIPEPWVETATGTGTAYFGSDTGTIEDLTSVDESDLPSEGKPDVVFPHGFFSFRIAGLTPGETVTLTIALPSALPVGSEYWKYGPTAANPAGEWYRIPIGDDDGDEIITITLTDGGIGDDDLSANGEIIDKGGPALPPTASYVVSCDDSGTEWNTFELSENVYCYGANLPASTPVDIYVVNNKDDWEEGNALTDVSGGYETVTTGADGSISTALIWCSPLMQGSYDIVVDTNRNGEWNEGEPIDSWATTGFEAIPEFTTIAIPVAAILGLLFLFWRKRKKEEV